MKILSAILFIALLISQLIINVQRKEINLYQEYVADIHDNWTSSSDSTGWRKGYFYIPDNNKE